MWDYLKSPDLWIGSIVIGLLISIVTPRLSNYVDNAATRAITKLTSVKTAREAKYQAEIRLEVDFFLQALESGQPSASLLVILMSRLEQAKYFAQTWSKLYLLNASVWLGFSVALYDNKLISAFFLFLALMDMLGSTAARRRLSFLETVTNEIGTDLRKWTASIKGEEGERVSSSSNDQT